jgi:NTE family protein
LEFHRAAEVIDLGRELAATALDGYRRTLTSEIP